MADHLDMPPAFLMSPETQPRAVGKAHEPSSNKLPAEYSSLLIVIEAPEAPEVCLQAHLTNAAVISAVCLWQVLVSASCPIATRKSSFLLKGSCQAQHQHQKKGFSGFSRFTGWNFLTRPHFSCYRRSQEPDQRLTVSL